MDVHNLGVAHGTNSMLLKLVDRGIGYPIECVLRKAHQSPTSLNCMDALMQYWIYLETDRGAEQTWSSS